MKVLTAPAPRPRRNRKRTNTKVQAAKISTIRNAVRYNIDRLEVNTITMSGIPRSMICGEASRTQPRGGVLRLTDREFQTLISKGYVTKHSDNRAGQQIFDRDRLITELKGFIS